MRAAFALVALLSSTAYADKPIPGEQPSPTDGMTLLSDPHATLVAGSAAICNYQAFKREVLADIREAKKYARVGGVMNMQEIYGLQEQLRGYDDSIANVRSELAPRKPLSCKLPEVIKIAACQGNDECSDPIGKLFMVVR